jgi:hypothetical protein
MTDQVNENTQYPFRITLKDADDVLTAPTTLDWRLDCVTTGTEITSWTALGAASTVNHTVPATANVMQDSANYVETKRITVSADRGTDTEVVQFLNYDLLNSAYY